MSKQALEGKRTDAFAIDPDFPNLIIVGLDTKDGPEHPFWDPRSTWPVDEDLVKSMMTIGWFGTILVQKQKDGRVFITDGRQRVKAAREANRRLAEAGKEPVFVVCLPRRGGEVDIIAVAANELRQNDPPLMKAEKAAAMLNRGRTETEVMLAFGLSESGLKNLLSLSEAHPAIRKAVSDGQINATAAYELARLPLEKQEPALQELSVELAKLPAATKAQANGEAKHTRGMGTAARHIVRGKTNGASNGDGDGKPVSAKLLRLILKHSEEHVIDPTAVQTIKWLLGQGTPARISGLTAAIRGIEEMIEKRHSKRAEKAK